MFNVLPAPGEVFQEIKEREVAHSNWILPALVWMIIGGAAVILMFSHETFQYEMKKQQEKQIQMQVKRGKMTQDQADQVMANMPPWVMKVAQYVAAASVGIVAFLTPFFWGFIVWLLASVVYKADVEYMKGVEAAGLASMIYVLAALFGSLVSVATGKLTIISPAYFVENFDMTNRNHMMLAALNPFYLWYGAVIAVSISVLANVPLRKPLVWCLLVWVGLRALALSNPYTMNFVL
jgi:hypothetical protein